MTDEDRHLYELQGRLLACEKFNTMLLASVAAALRPDDALQALTKLESGFLKGIQHTDLPMVGEESDVIWETMGRSVRLTLSNARAKLEQANIIRNAAR